ncbi:uncharacterized protein FOMMEDRAFT_168159 [Fomitiporia mediterranea MF3/22]|uniref:uncharacterized protein n=1 Tax=Fomitiporia mediterranea (strain MF3/22) TaxID=694068 RepID=UPI000440952B|nr:uncharacterized protein FOMMEDRAFT_168159 [Fomitiporia mediterranea MF3/22]EJD03098.1 hypothetical protein FOMMEDRAFT_168159 [Fomitiporia mediterranea MF3/22]
MEAEARQSQHSLQHAPTPASPTNSVDPVQTSSSPEGRPSEDVSYSAFYTPDPGISALSLPPSPSSSTSRTRQYDQLRQAGPRDSGIDTNMHTNRTSGFFSQSMPNLPPLMPPVDDRPDLWQTGFEPPTFRPRNPGVDATHQWPQHDHAPNFNLAADVRNHPRPPPHGFRRVFAFFGYGTGNRYRKDLVALLWTLIFGFIQFAIALSMIIYSVVHRSPRHPSISEWKACDKPLGLWSCFWIVKVGLDCCMTYWGWRRDWKSRQRTQNSPEADAETGASGLDTITPVDTNMDPPTIGSGDRIGSVDRQRRRLETNSQHARLYSRFSLLLSLIIISWFLTAQILIFTSLPTCRKDAPHLWWLVFSFLCLQYLVLFEVFATAVIVFIIGPLIYLFWNIILICLGRHPMQNPHFISPEIGKIPKNVVDQIPLVLYIPAPPDGADEKKDISLTGVSDTTMKPTEIATTPKVGTAEHTYPPKQAVAPPKRRFAFLSRKAAKSVSAVDTSGKTASQEGEKPVATWEDCWESGEFPFVRLDANRASCAICLLDFEEPKRRVARDVIRSWAQKNREGDTQSLRSRRSQDQEMPMRRPSTTSDVVVEVQGASSSSQNQAQDQDPATTTNQPEVVQHTISSSDNSSDADIRSLRLQEAGEGAQPLRLLQCGHAFHKTCVDPWLTDVSGRCPTCQRPVVFPKEPKKKSNRVDTR